MHLTIKTKLASAFGMLALLSMTMAGSVGGDAQHSEFTRS